MPPKLTENGRGKSLPIVASCEGCGACCQHMGYPSYIRATECHAAEASWLNMPADLKMELLRFMASYDEPTTGALDGVCFWYDAANECCKHHEHRPNVCRDFEVGGTDCLAWRVQYSS